MSFISLMIFDISSFPLILIVLILYYSQKRPFHTRADPVYTSHKTSGWVPRVMASSMVGSKANYSTQPLLTNEPVVSVDWLHANLRVPDLKVLAIACICCVLLLHFFPVWLFRNYVISFMIKCLCYSIILKII